MKAYSLNTKLHFGKFRGKTVSYILSLEPSYIDWCMKEVDHFFITDNVMKSIKDRYPEATFSKAAKQRRAEKRLAFMGGKSLSPRKSEPGWQRLVTWIGCFFSRRVKAGTREQKVRRGQLEPDDLFEEGDVSNWEQEDNLDNFHGDPDDFRFADESGDDARAAWYNTH